MNNWTDSQNNHGRVGCVGAGPAMKKIVIATALLLSLTGCSSAPKSTFETALIYCYGEVPANSLSSDEKEMAVRIEIGGSRDEVWCLLKQLHFPDSVGDRAGKTSAMDGEQSATADGITVSWTAYLDGPIFHFVDKQS